MELLKKNDIIAYHCFVKSIEEDSPSDFIKAMWEAANIVFVQKKPHEAIYLLKKAEKIAIKISNSNLSWIQNLLKSAKTIAAGNSPFKLQETKESGGIQTLATNFSK